MNRCELSATIRAARVGSYALDADELNFQRLLAELTPDELRDLAVWLAQTARLLREGHGGAS